MAEEIRFRRKPESRRLDFPPQRRLFNAMQGFRDAYACARLRRMVGDHQHTARFERLEQAAIHPCAVDIHERRVVIGKKESDQIEIAHAGRDRKSTRLNSSHLVISYAVFCLKKKKARHKSSLLTTAMKRHAQQTLHES